MKNYSNPYEAPKISKDGERFKQIIAEHEDSAYLGLIATDDGWYDTNGEKVGTGAGEGTGEPYAYMLTTDEDGNLYCEYADTDMPPNFIYDEETGYVYYVTENSTLYEVLNVDVIVEKVLGQLPGGGGAALFSLRAIDNEIGTQDLIISDNLGNTVLELSFVRGEDDLSTIMTVSNIEGQSVDIAIKDGQDGIDGQDYVLSENDKNEIAELVKNLISLNDYAKKEDIPKDYIKTVNDIPPDEHGNVVVTVTTNPPEPVLKIEDMKYDPDNPGKQYVMDGYIYAYMKHTKIVPAHDKPNFTNYFDINKIALNQYFMASNIVITQDNYEELELIDPKGVFQMLEPMPFNRAALDTSHIIRVANLKYEVEASSSWVQPWVGNGHATGVAGILVSHFTCDVSNPNGIQTINIPEGVGTGDDDWRNRSSLKNLSGIGLSLRTGWTKLTSESLENLKNIIITLDEEITYTHVPEKKEEWYEWTNTNQTYNKTDYSKEVAELQANAKALETRLKLVEENESTGVSVPNYVVEEIDRITPIIKSKENPNTLSFAFATDLHMVDTDDKKKILNNIVGATNMLASNANLAFFATGGDNLESTLATTKESVLRAAQATKDKLKKLTLPYFTATGNHDNNSLGSRGRDLGTTAEERNKGSFFTEYDGVAYNILDEEMYMALCKQCERFGEIHYDYNNMGKMYCYVDFPVQKIRMFILNCIDIPIKTTTNSNGTPNTLVYAGQETGGFSNAQLNFVANNLYNLENDWAALFISHYLPYPLDVLTSTGEAVTAPGDEFGIGWSAYNGEVLWNIVKAYKNSELYESSGVGKSYLTTNTSQVRSSSDFNHSVNVDFREKKGEVIGFVTGHTHRIRAWKKDDIYITSTCAATSSNGGLGDDNTIDEWKTAGTARETAFDIITIDRKAGKISYTGYGANKNREIEYKKKEV